MTPAHSFLRSRQAGFTLLEVFIALTILVVTYFALLEGYRFTKKHNVATGQRAFASQKAIQMMEELRGLIENTSNSSIGTLDDYDDGSGSNYVLTTNGWVTDPADVLSGNSKRLFYRRISVHTVPNEPLARRVYVRVYLAETNEVLAETVSVLRTVVTQNVPTQVYDLYILALENVPGWWSSLSTLKPMFDNVLNDLQTRNPNLEIRPHWITRLGYGRDPFYAPFTNSATRSDALTTAGTYVYFYPGNIAGHSSGADFQYYVPSNYSGPYILDGVNTDATDVFTSTGALGGSMADQFNHLVRYPDEERLFNAATTYMTSVGQSPPEMSLRMLWEKMLTSPNTMRNSMIVNLHGELLPMPPMRNFSDAAKNPRDNPFIRVVTHPEKLEYSAGEVVKLRVYSYVTNPSSWTHTATLSSMSVLLTNVVVSTSNLRVRQLVGNQVTDYLWQTSTRGVTPGYDLSYPNTYQMLITFSSVPIRSPINSTTNRGLPSGNQLYGMEYIPCVISTPHATIPFTEGINDMRSTAGSAPKNTARWVIELGTTTPLSSGVYTFETRIGTDVTEGSAGNVPTNLSRTYTWVGTSAPITEKYQFIGDPRHMPYYDVKKSSGYNWYFTSVSSPYLGFSKASNLWGSALNVDFPRFTQMLRTGLMSSGSLWNSITGFSNYYVGLGGEIGYDSSNGFNSGIQIVRTAWDPTSTSVVSVNEIIDSDTENSVRVVARTSNNWWSLYWLGELYPDDAYSNWSSSGNLPIGSGNFYRATYSEASTGLTQALKRTAQKGATSFLNGNSTAGNTTWFTHEYWDTNTSSLTNTGNAIAADFNFPLLTAMTAARPFQLDSNTADRQPTEWSDTIYSSMRTTLTTEETIYDSDTTPASYDCSASIRLSTSTASYGRVVMNGLSAQNNFGAAEIGKLCVVSLLRTFLQAGTAASVGPIKQLPYISISSPSLTQEFVNPSSVTVVWTSTWTRWDGQKYTTYYPDNYSQTSATASLSYFLKYSNDNGANWYFMQDSTATKAGQPGSSAYTVLESTRSYLWDVSNTATFPEGSYLVRVEAFSRARPQHYSYHQTRTYIKR